MSEGKGAELADRREIAEFGPASIQYIPHRVINTLRQVRTTFDPEEIAQLAESIKPVESVDGRTRYDLMQAPRVSIHTRESAERYLALENLTWGTDYSVDGLLSFVSEDGERFVFLTAGERRDRAIDLRIALDQLSPDSLVACSVVENPDYLQEFTRQFVENNARVNPSLQDEAFAICAYLKTMRTLDPDFTQAQCARDFSVRPERVGDAVIFTNYPTEMQALADKYSFTSVVNAKEIFEMFQNYYVEREKEGDTTHHMTDGTLVIGGPDQAAAYEVETCFLRIKSELLKRRADRNRRPRDMSLKAQAEMIRASFEQPTFAIEIGGLPPVEEEDIRMRRQMVGNDLWSTVEAALRLLENLNMMDGKRRDRLGAYATIAAMEDISQRTFDELATAS